jgi:hypothetical protein
MNRIAWLTLFVATVACASESADSVPDETWVGTITAEGDVTTVVNESGSVWGGTATLVEELSIGVELGEEPYMFGSVADVWATGERIYVVDSGVPVLRVFDHEGRHVRDIGGRGQGPGEFEMPNAVAVTTDGRILVREGRPGQRTNVYSADGEPLDTWQGDPTLSSFSPITLTYDGDFYSQTFIYRADDSGDRVIGMGKMGPDGIDGEPLRFPEFDYEPPIIMFDENRARYVPLVPFVTTVMLPSGALVAGLSSEYRFTVARPDGSTMIVEKYWEPIPISDEEAEWHRRQVVASGRRPNPSFQWDGAEMPDHHPAFGRFLGDRSGRIWVIRRSAVDKVPDCTEDPLDETVTMIIPCWQVSDTADVFDEATGKFLGEVALPDGVTLGASFIEGDAVYTPIEDEAGTIRVERFRLVLPGDEQPAQ